MRQRRSQRGFTLIEMMVVVAIIAILGAISFSVATKPFSSNAKTAAEQVSSMINFAKLRAQVTRRVQRVQIEPNMLSVWELDTTGLVIPTTPTPTWSLVQQKSINSPASMWNVTASTVTATGNTPAVNPALLYYLYVRPDSQATASTIYTSDKTHKWRVIVYHATGGVYAREGW